MSGPRESITRTCVSLRLTQRDAMKSLARETGAPVSELTRRAVNAFLASRVPGYMPTSQYPGPDLAAGQAVIATRS